MAGVPDATLSEIENGGRTVEEILEAMKQENKRNPGPAQRFLANMKSQAVSTAKAEVKSMFREYMGMLKEGAEDAGLDTNETDTILSGIVGDLFSDLSEEATDVAVNGPTPQEQVKIEEDRKAAETGQPTTAQNNTPTYAPTEQDMSNIWLQQREASKVGKAPKLLSYTDEQLNGMSPDGMVNAAKVGLVSTEKLISAGLDVTDVLSSKGKQFITRPEQRISVPKVKVLPDYKPGAEFGMEGSDVVTSERDMLKLGDDEFYENTKEPAQDVSKQVANASIGVGQDLMSKADLSLVRGEEADKDLGLDRIMEKQRQQELEGDGFISFDR